MKKTLLLLLTIISLMLLSACKSSVEDYTKSFINTYMDTYVRVDYSTDDEDLALEIATGVENILAKYDDLTNNFKLPDDDAYSPNIYEINQNIGVKLAIHKDLYDVLVLSEEMKTLTDGYFDIGIGKLIDLWKAQMLDEYDEVVYPNNTMTEEAFNSVVATAQAMDFSDSIIALSEENGLYYIETAGTNLKLDLGAIAKGYATQKIREYLIEKGLTYFMINNGTSSFVFGQKIDRELGFFYIGLDNPTNPGNPYGIVHVKDISLTTSGDYRQYVLYNDIKYHHIISPKTKLPMHYYHSLSLIADDAGILDALSTALFSMSPETLETWLSGKQTELGIETISYNIDGTITTYLIDTYYEEA